MWRPRYAYTVAIGATNTVGTRTTPSGVMVIRLKASVDCWVSLNVPAAVGSSVPLNAMETEYWHINAGDIVNVVDNDGATTGSLSVVEMSK